MLAKRVQESFAASLATRLSADELWQLTRFYSERPGAQFLKVQQRLFDALASDLLAMQEAMMAGERPAQAALGPDFEERNELLGLFDEFVRIQWGIADPGPGKDRSGFQAIPLMVGGAVDRRLGKLIAVWNQMPSEDRAVILRWRDSPLAKKERDAIFESAKRKFVMTCFASIIDTKAHTITYANACHNFPYLLRANKTPDAH